MKFTLNKDAKKAYFKALKQGIVEDSIEEIVAIVEIQEIVSYCTSKGCVSFDDSDLEIDQKQKAFVELQEARARWERHL